MHFLVFLPQKRKTLKKIKKTFKNPLTNRQENSIIDKLNTARPVGQAVKTLASHAENMGSIPVRVTNDRKQDISPAFSFSVVGDPYAHQTQRLAQSATVHGFETQPRRLLWRPCKTRLIPVRVLFLFLSLVTRTLIEPLALCVLNMGIAARGIICTDYAYCDVCTYHLLARQDTDSVGMRIPNEAVGELVLQRRVQVYSPLGEIPVSEALSCGANSRTKFRVARCPRDLFMPPTCIKLSTRLGAKSIKISNL